MSDEQHPDGSPRYVRQGTLWSKLKNRLQKHGPGYVVRRSIYWAAKRIRHRLRSILAPIEQKRATPQEFRFQGRPFTTYHHRYNFTWRNERAVELPVAFDLLGVTEDQQKPVYSTLELGCVLPHYLEDADWTVVDLVEQRPNVINEDFIDFESGQTFERIVSISTVEHVGLDDGTNDPERAIKAIAKCRSLLSPGGIALITFANGYNRFLDDQVMNSSGLFDQVVVLRRTSVRTWEAASDIPAALSAAEYGRPYEGGCVVTFGFLERKKAGK